MLFRQFKLQNSGERRRVGLNKRSEKKERLQLVCVHLCACAVRMSGVGGGVLWLGWNGLLRDGQLYPRNIKSHVEPAT